jgi:N-ethylmaleimide reductase
MAESDSVELYTALVRALLPSNLAYLHLVETNNRKLTELIRAQWPGVLILNPHRTPAENPATPETAAAALRAGLADAVSLATSWLANPDLSARIRVGGPFNEADRATYYGGDHRGYTDYATLET